LEDAKAGPRTVYLNDPALELLAGLPRLVRSEYVLPGDRAGGHLVNVQKAWRKITTAAHLDNLRVHDLRHSFASVAAAAGMNLPLVGRLLGHKELATSLRYSHLAADPVRAASQEVGRLITDAMARQSGQKVVPMRPKG
jgi:integrase